MTTRPKSHNYYDLLHVSSDAPVEIIRGSYRTMMQQLKHHPDLGGDTTKAALINEAYAVLSNADKRARYDAELKVPPQGDFAATKQRPQAGSATQPKPRTANPRPSRRALDPTKECLFCQSKHQHGKFVEVDAVCANCGSPLVSPNNCRIESQGKRAVIRFDKNQSITFFTHWPQSEGFTARTEDVSLHGMRLVTQQALEKTQRIKIITNTLEAIAIVMHCDKQSAVWRPHYVAGVSFETLRLIRKVGGFVSARA